MTAHVSAEVRAESIRRAKRRVRRWRMVGFPAVLLALGLLSALAVAAVITAGGGV